MPSKRKDRDTWQGIVVWKGKRYRAHFPSRRAAADWEADKRRELAKEEKTPKPTGTDFLTFCNRYCDDVELRFTVKVFKEKKALCETLIKRWGNPAVDEITPGMVNEYFAEQAQKRSPNAHNRDRKNLLAMWNWGRDILDLQSNPVARIKKLPHDREPQYTPPTADILKILAAAKPEEKVFLQCYLHTGARRSEIFRWTWNEDINFERREVRLGTRKTRDGSMSYETLPMNQELYDALWWWWNNRPIKDTPYSLCVYQHAARPSLWQALYRTSMVHGDAMQTGGSKDFRVSCASEIRCFVPGRYPQGERQDHSEDLETQESDDHGEVYCEYRSRPGSHDGFACGKK